jgi:large conductance mechanosensitive channel
LAYGNFITATLNFLIIAFVLLLVIQGMNRLKKKEDAQSAAKPAPTASEKLLSEIRDLLKNQSAVSRTS